LFSLSPVVLTLLLPFLPLFLTSWSPFHITTNCQILKLPDSSWRGWGLSLLLLLLL
jgi:hypothetical protein